MLDANVGNAVLPSRVNTTLSLGFLGYVVSSTGTISRPLNRFGFRPDRRLLGNYYYVIDR